MRIDHSKMVMNKDVWVVPKEELGHAKAELVFLDAHVVLLENCNDRL